jgi:hypothetical protein
MKYDRRNKEAFTIYLPKLSNVSVISMKRSVMGQLRQEFFYRPNKIDNGISIDLSSLRFTSMDKEMDIAASRTASVISSILTYLYASNLRTFSNNVIINNRQLASDVRRLFFLEKDQRVEAFGDSSIFTFADTLSNLIHIHLMSKVVEKISGIGKDKFSLITEEYDEYCKDQMEGFKFAGHDIQEYMRYLVKRGAYAGQDKATIGCMLYNEYTRFLDDELILDVQQSIDIDNNKCLKFTYTEFFEHRCRVIY